LKRRDLKNVAASVRQRLLNAARESGRPYDELLQYFAMERFLFRLSASPHGERFVLKGGLLLATWYAAPTRATRDIDLLGNVKNDVDRIVAIVGEVCGQVVEPDGLEFDAGTIVGERIAEEAEYEGVRVRFRGNLDNAQLSMQIDVGFGDAVVPAPVEVDYPTLLDLPAPRVRAYTRESVIAEKFHTMVRRGLLNSRMRDFFERGLRATPGGPDGRVRGRCWEGGSMAGIPAQGPAAGCSERAERSGSGTGNLPRAGRRIAPCGSGVQRPLGGAGPMVAGVGRRNRSRTRARYCP